MIKLLQHILINKKTSGVSDRKHTPHSLMDNNVYLLMKFTVTFGLLVLIGKYLPAYILPYLDQVFLTVKTKSVSKHCLLN
ncbi:hypothetical protein GFK82_00165 [Candidatus Steffania adelgidicola]|nr:hypothetical protein GFK82_00165 [Candidatus Steffania adelgidicola]